jgi:hypothetical protein
MSKGVAILAALVAMALPLWAQRPYAAYALGASTRALRTVAWQDRDCDRDHDRDGWHRNRDRYRSGQYPHYGPQYPYGGYPKLFVREDGTASIHTVGTRSTHTADIASIRTAATLTAVARASMVTGAF